LLIIGGIVQVLVVALHVTMFFSLARAKEIPVGLKPTLCIFNAAVLTTVLFFAYVSFFRRRELIETVFGRAVASFIAVFYVQRGLTEVLVNGVHPVSLGMMLAIAALYAVAAVPSRTPRAAEVIAERAA
jgi:hypothetical protein